ncbi:MAG: MATE family efflux transporter [Pseudomonadota bacterium]
MTPGGNPLTHRRVLALALPVVASNATVPLVGIVDTAVVGQLGAAAPIGAVGMGAIILSTLFWVFGALRLSTVGLVGQALGAGDRDEVAAGLSRALLVAGVAGGALIALQWPIFAFAFWLSPASAEVEGLTRTYLAIRIWTAPAAIGIYAITGWLVAMGRTGRLFWMQLVTNGSNVGLSVALGLWLDMGVAGVALATVIAELAGAALGLWYCRSAFANPAWRDRGRVLARAQLVKMGLLNSDLMIRSALQMIIFSSFVFLGARFGDVTLAANEVLIQLVYFSAYAMDGFAVAAETLVSHAYGRRARAEVRSAALRTSAWGLGFCVAIGLLYLVAGPALIDLMARDAEVRAAARDFLPWLVVAPVIGCASWMLDGIFVGAARGRDMRNSMIVNFVLYWLAVLALLPALGNTGLWIAILLSFTVRGITLGWRYPALERDAALA